MKVVVYRLTDSRTGAEGAVIWSDTPSKYNSDEWTTKTERAVGDKLFKMREEFARRVGAVERRRARKRAG